MPLLGICQMWSFASALDYGGILGLGPTEEIVVTASLLHRCELRALVNEKVRVSLSKENALHKIPGILTPLNAAAAACLYSEENATVLQKAVQGFVALAIIHAESCADKVCGSGGSTVFHRTEEALAQLKMSTGSLDSALACSAIMYAVPAALRRKAVPLLLKCWEEPQLGLVFSAPSIIEKTDVALSAHARGIAGQAQGFTALVAQITEDAWLSSAILEKASKFLKLVARCAAKFLTTMGPLLGSLRALAPVVEDPSSRTRTFMLACAIQKAQAFDSLVSALVPTSEGATGELMAVSAAVLTRGVAASDPGAVAAARHSPVNVILARMFSDERREGEGVGRRGSERFLAALDLRRLAPVRG